LIDQEKIQQLIDFHKQNMKQMENMAAMFGGVNNPFMEQTKKIAVQLTSDTIQALQEYSDMLTVKALIDKEQL
jgi:hypothetical protein